MLSLSSTDLDSAYYTVGGIVDELKTLLCRKAVLRDSFTEVEEQGAGQGSSC